MDLSSWAGMLTTLVGLVVVAFIGVGIRLIMMMTIQQRRERMNRQINERLRVLIAAYKVLGGSFTGDLSVDPTHLRDLHRRGAGPGGSGAEAGEAGAAGPALELGGGSDRTRRIRDAVEAALSDIILLGTEDQVRLAAHAAGELVAGQPVHTHELVVSLRAFIREALDLAAIPGDIVLPQQGPARPSGGGGGREGGRQSGGGGGGGAGGMGAGMGLGAGMAMGAVTAAPGEPQDGDAAAVPGAMPGNGGSAS